MIKRFSLRFTPTEIVISVYLAITGFFILINFRKLPNGSEHLATRLAIICIFALFAYLQYAREKNSLVQFLRLFLPLTLMGYLYNETDYLNNLIFSKNLDGIFSRAEFAIFGSQPSLHFALAIHAAWFAEIMYFGYFSYYLLLAGLPLYFYFRKQVELSRKSVFILINSLLLFYLLFIILPVAGPQFYFTDLPELPAGYIFGPLMHFIQATAEAPTAAFPSSHIGICLIVLWIAYRNATTLFWWILPIAILLMFSTVYIRAHYVIDVIAAIIVTPAIHYLSDQFYRKLSMKTSYN